MASCKLPYLWAHWWQVWELSFFSSGQKCDWNATLRLKCLRWLPMLLSCSWACFQVPGQAQGAGWQCPAAGHGCGRWCPAESPPAPLGDPSSGVPSHATSWQSSRRCWALQVQPWSSPAGRQSKALGRTRGLSCTSAQQRERGGARQGFRSGVQVLINFAC